MDNNEVYALFEDIKSGLKSAHRFTEFAIKLMFSAKILGLLMLHLYVIF
jgi:hypothetical protein